MNPLPPLPRHWSAEQAMAVYEFLPLLSEQLWCHYRADFVALLGEQAVEVLQPVLNPPSSPSSPRRGHRPRLCTSLIAFSRPCLRLFTGVNNPRKTPPQLQK